MRYDARKSVFIRRQGIDRRRCSKLVLRRNTVPSPGRFAAVQ
jgi:hypothetical protein